MNEISGAIYKNTTASGQISGGVGKVYGFIVNSHSSGTLRLNDGFTATTAGIKATATLTSDETNVSDESTVTIGGVVYRFMETMAQAYDVQIGESAAVSLDNLKAAINASGTPGTEYFADTLIHPTVTATTNTDTTQVVEAKSVGFDGNDIAVATDDAHLTWGESVVALSGGYDAAPLIINTFSFPAGSGVYKFPEPANFVNALYATIGGTADITILYN